MRTKAERDQDFDAIKTNLFEAGVAALQAAQAGEQLFDTSLKAIAEAMNVTEDAAGNASRTAPKPVLTEVNLIYEILLAERQDAEAAGNFEAYVAAARKLQTLEELAIEQLERKARKLEIHLRIANAQHQLSLISNATTTSPTSDSSPSTRKPWTESELKKEFKTLERARTAFGITATSWKQVVEKANQ